MAANGWAIQTRDGSFTSEFMTAMMTISFDMWQTLFGAGSDKVNNYSKSGFCSAANNAKNCPITCGKCKLYDRSSASASMYESWLATNKDSKTGVVTIPYVFDNANKFVTNTVKDMTRNATAIWAAVTCVDFKELDQVPKGERYIIVTADVDANGNPSGCLADPVGLAPDADHPTRVNLGGCSENKRPLGSMIHEFGHVLGLVHTQMRPDRDRYITLNPAMVKQGFEPNFFLSPYAFDGDDGVYSPYDYGSIMHYTRTQAANAAKFQAGSTDWSGTFKLLQTLSAGVTLGQRDRISTLDVAEVNSIYQCNGVLASGGSTGGSGSPAIGGAGAATAVTTQAPATTTQAPTSAGTSQRKP